MTETTYPLPGAPGLKIALIADLHGKDPRPVMESLEKNRPDMIALAGDMTTYKRGGPGRGIKTDLDRFLPLAEAFSKAAPTFFSLGNHEWMMCEEEIALIERAGVKVLDNTWTAFRTKKGRPVLVGGLTSSAVTDFRSDPERNPWPANSRPGTAVTGWLDDFERREEYKILLCHHPEYWPLFLKTRKIDLVMSGHAHGGQIRLFGRGLFAPGQGIFPRYTSGVFRGRHGVLVVSRGLANTGEPVPRLFNKTQIVYLEGGKRF